MENNSKIYIAGHNGMVGSSIVRKLIDKGFNNLVYINSQDCDLTNQELVNNFFIKEKPEYVFIAAAKVGGIMANNEYRAQFLYENMMIQNNLIHSAYINKIKKLLFLGSSCIYPKYCKQPMVEESLLSDYLEPTNEPYAIAKISGIKMCENYFRQYGSNYISIMPTNLYGPNDNYDLESSHVLPALIRKIHTAKINNKNYVEIWGSGKVMREFLYVDDLAEACIHMMQNLEADKLYNEYNISHINVGYGSDISIIDLVHKIAKIINFSGEIKYDRSKPDGTPKKIMNSSRINELGWFPKVELDDGIIKSFDWYLKNIYN